MLSYTIKVVLISTLLSGALISVVLCENILVYQAIGSHSTRISMWPLVDSLSNKGHNVTFLSPYEASTPHAKVHEYVPRKWHDTMGSWEDNIRFFDVRKNGEMMKMWFQFPNMGIQVCEVLYSDPEFLEWLRSSKFDLIIMETSVNECAYGLVHLFKAKLIVYSTTSVVSWYFDAHGLPDETSSITDLMLNFPPGNEMRFTQRLVNAINPILWTLMREYWYFPKLEEITKTALQLQELPSFSEIEKNASLVMITQHFAIEYPRSLPSHVLPVGGLVVSEEKDREPLPNIVKDFIGPSDFIFISFGTVAEFTNFDESIQQEFISGLSNFPHLKFIWKSTNKIKFQLPHNVLEMTWAPQQTLLAHPKIKAFITHSGLGSIVEATHFGVPLILLPVQFEQDKNARCIASKGVGIILEILTLRKSQLELAILEILRNPKFSRNMKMLSKVFRDRQHSALENAVWWTEFILRHDNSNEYLQPPNIHQSWWVRRQLDVWMCVFICALAIIVLTLYIGFWLVTRIVEFLIFGDSFKVTTKEKRE